MTGIVTLHNTKEYPFNDSGAAVELPSPAVSADYAVRNEVIGADGCPGAFRILDRTRNAFVIAFSGSARSVEARWTVDAESGSARSTMPDMELSSDGILKIDGLALELSGLQQTGSVFIHVYADKNGLATLSRTDWLLARVKIPARTYTIRENGIVEDVGFRYVSKTDDPLDLSAVEVQLFAREVR